MPTIPRLTRGKKQQFLETLRRTGNISASARAAGISRAKIYAKRAGDKQFREEWENALEGALDDLEEEIRRRALEGTEKPVYYAGKKCGSVTNFNDTLAMFLLKAKRPEIFGESEKGEGSFRPSSGPREKLLKKLAKMGTGLKGDEQ